MKLVIIIIALVFAVVASVMVSGVFKEPAPPPVANAPAPVQQVAKVDVFVARVDIPVGTKIKQDDFEVRALPANLLPPGAVQAGTQIDAQITSGPISKDEPLTVSKLRNPNDPGYISGQLPEGMRAITISVGLTDSVAGFVAPGDVVDILFTFDISKASAEGGDLKSTSGGAQTDRIAAVEALLSNVRVIAVDKRVTSGTAPAVSGQPAEAQPPYPTSVTLAVNQRDAQKVRLAEKVGKLSLILRSLADADNTKRPRPTLEQDLTRLMSPAYFPVLFNSDQAYDSEEVNLFDTKDNDSDGPAPEKTQVNIYRGSVLESKEIKGQ